MRFADVLVPETVKRQLIGAVISHRVSHAQLFYGLEGTHTLALALAYAQYVNCPNRTEEDSCGECPSCRQFSQLAHPDLHFYFPHPAGKELSSYNYYDEWRSLFLETNGLFSLNDWYRKIGMENKQGIINKEDVELLLQQTALKSYESEYKIFIIWMVEKLNGQVAPKLLKTLEEPDGKTLFLLITANYDQVLNTILSRSQLLKINRFNNKELAEILQREKGCDAITARRMALMAENNLITALRNGEFPEEEKEQFALFQEMMRHAFALYHPIRNFEFNSVIQWVGKIESLGREGQKHFLRYALGMVRKCVLLNIQLDQMVPSVPEEELWLEKFKPFIRADNVSPYYTMLNNAVKEVEANGNTKMLFTDLVFSLGKYMK